jgi:hypothetical protein
MAIVLNGVIRKSRMKREFHVRFRERVGVVSIPALLDCVKISLNVHHQSPETSLNLAVYSTFIARDFAKFFWI